jgi:AraC family transcriptional regulator, transcriptional activator of pobA
MKRSGAREIRQVAFDHRAKPTVGIEVFRLQQLFDRMARGELPVELELPERVSFHILFVGISGSGQMTVDFRSVPIGARRLGFIAAGRVRQFEFDRAVDAWMVLIEPSVAVGLGTNVLSPAWEAPWLETSKTEHAELVAIVDQLVAEQARPLDAYQPELLASMCRTLVVRCERLYGQAPTPHAAQLVQFFTLLERDFATDRSVEHYARAVGFSPRRLGELLVEHTGKSTKQLIADRVLLELKRALAFTEVTVKQLAVDTGFDEPTNLVKFFRLHTKLTPLEFRVQQRTFLPSARGSAPSSAKPR